MPLAAPRYTIADLDRLPDDGNRYELLGGMLLVTPAPGTPHQVVLGRLTMELAAYLRPTRGALLVTPGVIQLGDDTQLEPDLLVFPTVLADSTSWRQIREWWLAVEVSGRASRVYDRDFKRDAYLRLGVREVWRMDLGEGRLYRATQESPAETPYTDALIWHPPEMQQPLGLDLPTLFGRARPTG